MLKNVQILRDQIVAIFDHFEIFYMFDLLGADSVADVGAQIRSGEQGLDIVFHCCRRSVSERRLSIAHQAGLLPKWRGLSRDFDRQAGVALLLSLIHI